MENQTKYYVYNIKTGVVLADGFYTKEEALDFIYEIEYNDRKYYRIHPYTEE